MTDATTTISLAPFVEVLQPYITAAVTTIVGAAVVYVASLFQKWTGIKVSQNDQTNLQSWISTQAGLAIAKSETNLSGVSIDAHTKIVADAADFVVSKIPDLLKATGKTPDDVAHLIASEIGRLQATAPSK